MNAREWAQIALYFAVLLGLAPLLGHYMARVYEGERVWLEKLLGPVERLAYRLAGTTRDAQSNWKSYALGALVFNVSGLLVVYALQRAQGHLPLDPADLPAVSADSAWNTAVSFASNTNWQGYAGETTQSMSTQMLGLTVQNFVSAATGMAVLVALIRGLRGRETEGIGNFWVDVVRGTLYVLLPLSLVLALVLVSQGVVQTLHASHTVTLLESGRTQIVAVGPAASQVAIKQLGTNGGGFFNANSAHPFENPNGLTNFVELVAILELAAALCFTFGRMVGDARQGRALLAAMLVIFVPLLALCVHQEQAGSPLLAALGAVGGNMEGKEVRFGVPVSALWATATTAASNGSVDAMHDSFTPLGGLVPLLLIQLGEIVFGGVGSGLYGMLMFALIAVFVAGLMVGRTPEYLGKKIEAREMKMASLVILVPASVVLVGTAIGVATAAGRAGMLNAGPHGFSEVLYALSSAGNNNGSAFAGLGANTVFYNTLLGIAMFLGRFWVMVPVLAVAGSLARKKVVPASDGTLPTHTPLFVAMLVGTIVVVGALTFIPSLALGPIVEHLLLHA